jgi:hypothetical protein
MHKIVDESRETDQEIYYFEFSTFEPNGSDFHPNLEEHRKMADELIPYLKELMKW